MTRPRVVSLVPAATDALTALGVGTGLVEVTDECRAPAGTAVVVGSAIPTGLGQGQIDALVASRLRAGLPLREVRSQLLAVLAPDVVVAQDLCAVCAVGSEEVTEALRLVGSPAVLHVYDPQRLSELVPAVRALAAAIGLAGAGERLGAALQGRLDALAVAVAGRRRPRVAVLEWTDPLWAAGHWVPDVVAAAGGVEVLGAPAGRSVPVSREAFAAAGPEVVLVAPCGLPMAAARTAAVQVSAWLPAGVRVLAVDGTVLTGAGPGLVEVAEALAGHLHPGVLPGVHAGVPSGTARTGGTDRWPTDLVAAL